MIEGYTRRLLLLTAIASLLYCSPQPTNQAEVVLEKVEAGEGWKRNAEIRTFTAADLWEYINGAAEQFVVYGVRDVATTDFITAEGAELTVDVYQMKDVLNAFGVYSLERNTGGPFPAVGSEGCWNGTSLYFYKGDYYVKMVAFDEDENLKPAIQNLAESIASVIPGEPWHPLELSVFPQENLIAKSEKYYPANVLAQPFFSNGYTAQYTSDEGDVQAFAIFTESPEAAQKSFEEYRQSLNDGERKFTDAETGEESFITTDSFYGRIVTARAGSIVAGAMGKLKDQSAKSLLTTLLANATDPAHLGAH